MVALLQTGLPAIAVDAIRDGVLKDKWKSPYQFLQLAAIEKLQREGLVNFDNVTFIHFFCPECKRQIYTLPELAGLHEWFYCTKCHPNSTTKEHALIRNGTCLGKDIPKDSEIRRC